MPRPIDDNDPFLSKLLKTIPTEIVGAYLFLCGVVGASNTASVPTTAGSIYPYLISAIFVIMLVLTPIYMWKLQNVKGWKHLTVSTISFAIWVYTLGGINGNYWLGADGGILYNGEGGPTGSAGIFTVLAIYSSAVGSAVLVLWTLASPLIVPPQPPDPPA